MALYGHKVLAATGVRETVDAAQLNQRGIEGAVLGPFPEAVYVTHIGMWTGRATGTNASIAYALWNRNEDGTPSERRGQTAAVSVTAAFTGNNGGTNIQATIASTDRAWSPSNAAILLMPGEQYVVGFKATLADIAYAVIPGATARHYRRTVATGDPTDPFAAAGSAVLGKPAIYLVGFPNTAPNTPALTAPGSGAFLDTSTPTFTGTFIDADIADYGDVLRSYKLELRQVGQTGLLWQAEYTADTSEKNASAFSRVYEGSTLIAGNAYEWRAAVADRSGTYSDWSAWRTLNINAAGVVTLDGTPTGKVELPTGIAYQGKWTHPNALSTNRVQVRVLQNNAVIKTGADVVKTVASAASPGTLFTISAAEAGIGTLVSGLAYEYQIRARATNGLWSPYSARRSFSVNAIPTVPSNLQPMSGSSTTVRPLIQVESTDEDDDEATGLLVELRIKSNAGSVLGTYQMTLNPSGVWEFQTTSTHLPTFGTYRFDARAYDGTAYSAYSAEHVFSYVDGPVIGFVAPTENQAVGTSTPTITWTVANQTKYHVLIYREGTTKLVYDSKEKVTSQTNHTVLPGYLKNGGAYDAVVTITDSSNQVGNSVRRSFSVVYAAAPILAGLQWSEAFSEFDPIDAPSGILLTWDISELPPGGTNRFDGYIISRRETGEDADDAIVLRTIRNIGQNRWTDWGPASNTQYTYAVSQIQRLGADTVQSASVETDAIVTFRTVVISSAIRGSTRRAVLRWDTSRSLSYADDQTTVQTWGSTAPTVIDGPVAYETFAGDFLIARFLNDPTIEPRAVFLALQDLYRSKEIVLVRDERGTRLFGKITQFSVNFRRAGHYGVRLQVVELEYREGEVP